MHKTLLYVAVAFFFGVVVGGLFAPGLFGGNRLIPSKQDARSAVPADGGRAIVIPTDRDIESKPVRRTPVSEPRDLPVAAREGVVDVGTEDRSGFSPEPEDQPPQHALPPHMLDPELFADAMFDQEPAFVFDEKDEADFVRAAREGGVPEDHIEFLIEAMKAEQPNALIEELEAAEELEGADLSPEEMADEIAASHAEAGLPEEEIKQMLESHWESVWENEDQLFEYIDEEPLPHPEE